MANICSFSMYVKGNKDDIQSFYNAMCQNGKFYMGRGADAEIVLDEDCANIDGWCKWSVQSAMIDNAISMRENPGAWYFGENVDVSQIEFITLFEACQKWNLDMEVYSEECGMEFQEHYRFVDGRLVVDECVDWYEYYLGDFETKEEAEEELEIQITDAEWDEREYVSRGGFEEWHFEI